MERLPIELLQYVLNSCSFDDKFNTATCNRNLYSKVKPLLWQAIQIRSGDLIADQPPCVIFNSVHSTVSLALHDETDIGSTDSFNFGFNFSRLLNCINPSILKTLCLKGLKDGLGQVLKRLTFVQDLCLEGIVLSDASIWNNVQTGNRIKKLVVKECNSSCTFFKSIFERNDMLINLEIDDCQFVTNELLLDIIKLCSGLESFSLSGLQQEFEINCLGMLRNLTNLKLEDLEIKQEASEKLWKGLPKLQSLTIFGVSNMSDESLEYMHHLNELIELNTYNCPGISRNCFFRKVSLFNKLVDVGFGTDMCHDDDRLRLYYDLSRLNRIERLEKIKIFHDDDIGGAEDSWSPAVSGLCCFQRKWIVTLDNNRACILEKSRFWA